MDPLILDRGIKQVLGKGHESSFGGAGLHPLSMEGLWEPV